MENGAHKDWKPQENHHTGMGDDVPPSVSDRAAGIPDGFPLGILYEAGDRPAAA